MYKSKKFNRYKDYLTNNINLNYENNMIVVMLLDIDILFNSTLAREIVLLTNYWVRASYRRVMVR